MRWRDRLFLAVLLLLGSVPGASVAAQPAAKVYRIGVLCPVTCETSDLRTFRAVLAALGYEEGENVVFEYRSAEGDLKRLPDLARNLVQLNVNVLYTTYGTASGLAAKRATTSIPVVVGSAADLVASGM